MEDTGEYVLYRLPAFSSGADATAAIANLAEVVARSSSIFSARCNVVKIW